MGFEFVCSLTHFARSGHCRINTITHVFELFNIFPLWIWFARDIDISICWLKIMQIFVNDTHDIYDCLVE